MHQRAHRELGALSLANMADAPRVATELARLIALEVPQLSSEESDRLLRYCTRILGSRIAGGGLAAEAQSTELARRRLVQAGRPADALSLTEGLARLHGAAPPDGLHNPVSYTHLTLPTILLV